MNKVWYIVICDKHGMLDKELRRGVRKVPEPKNKKDRYTRGCELCKSEEKND